MGFQPASHEHHRRSRLPGPIERICLVKTLRYDFGPDSTGEASERTVLQNRKARSKNADQFAADPILWRLDCVTELDLLCSNSSIILRPHNDM